MSTITKLWIGLLIFIILSPLGFFLPEFFKAGDAWGEWGTDGVKEFVGYIPRGLEKLSSLWSAPIPNYAFKGWEEKGPAALSFTYIVSALIGVAVIVCVVLWLGQLLSEGNLSSRRY